jgi:hypothetical protein
MNSLTPTPSCVQVTRAEVGPKAVADVAVGGANGGVRAGNQSEQGDREESRSRISPPLASGLAVSAARSLKTVDQSVLVDDPPVRIGVSIGTSEARFNAGNRRDPRAGDGACHFATTLSVRTRPGS